MSFKNKNFALVILGFIVAASLVFMGLLRDAPRDPGEQASRATTGGSVAVSIDEPRKAEVTRRSLPEEADVTTIRTLDTDKKPIGNATVQLYSTHLEQEMPSRMAPKEEVLVAGSTSNFGLLAITPPVKRGSAIVVTHPEFEMATYRSSEDLAGQLIEIRMVRGATLKVECSTRQEQPIAGVSIQVSQRPITTCDQSDSYDKVIPGPDSSTAIFCATSNSRGLAVFNGLPAGELYIKMRHKYYVSAGYLARKMPLIAVRGENGVAEKFDPIVGMHAVAANDEILSWDFNLPRALLLDHAGVMELENLKRSIEGGSPGSLVMLAQRRFDADQRDYLQLPKTVLAKLLTAKRGLFAVDLLVKEAANLADPQVVPDTGVAGGGSMGVNTEIRLINPDCTYLNGHAFIVLIYQGEDGTQLPVNLGGRTRLVLPVGSYVVGAHTSHLNRALGRQSIHVSSDGDGVVEVKLNRQMALCQYRIVEESGLLIDSGSVTVEHRGLTESCHYAYGLASSKFCLPAGRVVFRIHGNGCDLAEMPYEIATNPDGVTPIGIQVKRSSQKSK